MNTKSSKIENKVPNTSSSVIVLNTKISETENKIPNNDKYITTPEFNKLTPANFATRLNQAYLVNKTDCDNKLINFHN